MRTPLPQTGEDWSNLKARMADYAGGDVRWRDGKTAVYVFNAGPDIDRVQKEAYAAFMSENGLGHMAFPSLKRMDAEVVDFGLELFHAPEDAAGAITSGGTDSITMALKAARDYARKAKGVTGPLNLVLPRSAHPAFDKAATVMEVQVRRTPLAQFLADPAAISQAADDSTIMIVGSAPCFPYGLIDPIADLSALAVERDLWLHVDACVGGYIAPFVRMNGADVPAFDFGGAISAAWAVMNFLGVEGYRKQQGMVTITRERIESGVRALGFNVLGTPQLGLIAFSHPDANNLTIWSKLRERGWFTSMTTEPVGLHLMLSPFHATVADAYLDDLAWALATVKDGDSQPAVVQPRYA